MIGRIPIHRVLGIGLTWGLLWLMIMMCVVGTVRLLDPDSIDPGEGKMFFLIFVPMAILSGIAFSTLVLLGSRGKGVRSLFRAVLCGFLGSAIVQLGYLGHGAMGLAGNIQMALGFCAFGGLVSVMWLFIAKWWSRRRSLPQHG